MSDRKMSAKDKAFENERAKFRKEKRELEAQLQRAKIDAAEARMELQAANERNDMLRQKLDEAYEYIGMTEQELDSIKKMRKSVRMLSGLTDALAGVGGMYRGV